MVEAFGKDGSGLASAIYGLCQVSHDREILDR